MGTMSSVVVCVLMCSIIKCFFCLGAYLTENPHDNHVNYVRYPSTDFVLESTLQRTEKQLLLQQQSILPNKDWCNQTHFSHYLRHNPLNPELNPICYLLALLGAHHFLHISRIRVKLLTFRLLISYIYIYIYGAPILDVSRSHTTTQHSR